MSVERKEGRKPLLVFCHGLGGAKNAGIIDQLYHALDFSAVRFDFSGFGDATKPFTGLQDRVLQLKTILDTIDEDVVLVGHSLGGTTALLAQHPRITARVIIAAPTKPELLRENSRIIPGAKMTDATGREYVITELFVSEIKTLRIPLSTQPLLAVYGSKDVTVPITHSPTSPIVVLDDHDFEDTATEIVKYITHFLETL